MEIKTVHEVYFMYSKSFTDRNICGRFWKKEDAEHFKDELNQPMLNSSRRARHKIWAYKVVNINGKWHRITSKPIGVVE